MRDKDNYHKSTLADSDYIRSQPIENEEDLEQNYQELYIHEILEGKEEFGFPGMISLIRKFMDTQDYQQEHRDQIE